MFLVMLPTWYIQKTFKNYEKIRKKLQNKSSLNQLKRMFA